VELESHAAILQDLGCDYAQGYWFARPQPLANLVSTIHAIGASSSQ